MIKKVAFILILLANAAQASGCNTSKDEFKKSLKEFSNDTNSLRFEEYSTLVERLKACGFTPESVGTTAAAIQKCKRQLYNNAVDVIVVTKRASPDISLADDYRSFLRRALSEGVLDQKLQKKLEAGIQQGEKIKSDFIKARRNYIQSSCNKRRDFSNILPPVRDQGDYGWCYAYVAADLMSAKLKVDVSPVDLAFGYNFETALKKMGTVSYKDYIATGGQIKEAILSREKVGYCTSKDLNLEGEVGERLKAMKALAELETEGVSDENKLCESFTSLSQLYRSLSFDDFKTILGTSLKSEIFEKIREADCKDRIRSSEKIDIVENTYGDFLSSDQEFQPSLTENLFRSLDEGRVVGIGLDIGELLIPPTQVTAEINFPPGFDFSEFMSKEKTSSTPTKSSRPHGMVIIGNEINPETGECNFLIRNSYGESCSQFNSKVKCDKGKLKIPASLLETFFIKTTEIK